MKAAFYLATLMCGTFFGSTVSYAVSWLQVPGPEATQASCSISGIAVLSESDVWTVGSKGFSLNLPMQPLIEHWDRISWAQVRQSGAELGGALEAIAARSPDDVWAVGRTAQDQTLVERWNGRKWLVIPSPNRGSTGFLHAVCVISPDDAWAAGESLPHSYILTHWDGTVWSLVDGPPVDRSAISSLKAFAKDDIWAVGYKDLHVRASSNFILHWDGSTWSEVPSPNVGDGNFLKGVDGTAPSDVWAVGHAKVDSYHPVALHWDGTAWTAVPTPVNSLDQFFYAVKAISPTNVLAVGTSSGTPFSARWDGAQWLSTPTPPVEPSASLEAISARDGTIWAAGSYQNFSFVGRPDELFLKAAP